MTELICIVCPKGCHLRVDETGGFAVTGNGCERGAGYGQKELQNPTRTLTGTVALTGAALARLPVKTDAEIPKKDMLAAAARLAELSVAAPVRLGDVVLADILGTGANVVATRSTCSFACTGNDTNQNQC